MLTSSHSYRTNLSWKPLNAVQMKTNYQETTAKYAFEVLDRITKPKMVIKLFILIRLHSNEINHK